MGLPPIVKVGACSITVIKTNEFAAQPRVVSFTHGRWPDDTVQTFQARLLHVPISDGYQRPIGQPDSPIQGAL